ncbi:GNAT family N-acetyltransferase [Celerinatantimonas diazotrophica]|uniref:Acetyltransferase (GNAT) family protein n=1 Tax=Celerinatantimonas diazotrophica TaxID=412034 RepID=A0A4R1J9V0_9GAMM|nr:GNAT family N-acetyltransferase [Celerinatantimonas diazotrophica]TCK47403.1 acetyltransferase (GNAT) family protein [Celerinatantimonas diazotrophica]CAG9294979.1 Acetyltransferase [Celerinatantimonas diazotrophica]
MQFIESIPNGLAQLAHWPNNALETQLFAGPNLSFPLSVSKLLDSELDGWARMMIDGPQLLGYFQLKPCRQNSVRLCRVIVNPQHRRQGLGRLLIAHSIGFARDQLKVKRIELGVYQHNQIALNRYQYFGFKMINQHAVATADGQQWIVVEMEKYVESNG